IAARVSRIPASAGMMPGSSSTCSGFGELTATSETRTNADDDQADDGDGSESEPLNRIPEVGSFVQRGLRNRQGKTGGRIVGQELEIETGKVDSEDARSFGVIESPIRRHRRSADIDHYW